MSQKNDDGADVVSIFSAKRQRCEDCKKLECICGDDDGPDGGDSIDDAFAEAERRNREAKERMKREREKANRSTLRSYRIKF